MSQPKTAEEQAQYDAATHEAGPTENVVSTACPSCHVRFAMLAKFHDGTWYLRCIACGQKSLGVLKGLDSSQP